MKSNTKVLVYSRKGAEKYANLIREAGFQSVETAASEEEAVEKLPQTEVIFCWKFPTYLLSSSNAKSVRWIQSMGAGVDDLVADPNISRDILLTRIVDQFGGSISEYVFAHLLYIMKDMNRMRMAQKERKWDPFLTDCLAGKTIGVAGLGSIGNEVVRKARVFDMKIHGLSFSGKKAHIVDQHFSSDEWLAFVKDLDILVLTLPLTNETTHVVSEQVLQNMREGSLLINAGRGALINESALISNLSKGHLGATVLDVFETEPLPPGNKLWSMPNVYVTPHLSGPSISEDVCKFFAENLNRYLNDEPLMGVVHRDAGY